VAFDEHLREHQSDPRPERFSRGLKASCAGSLISLAALLLAGVAAMGMALTTSYSPSERNTIGSMLLLMLVAVAFFDLALLFFVLRWRYAGRIAALCLLVAALSFIRAAMV
jgi:hypothetical protein